MGSAGRFLTSEEYRKLWVGVLGGECGQKATLAKPDPVVLSARDRRGWRGLALVALLGEMGLRIGEAVQVRWEAFAAALGGSPVVQLPAEICKGRRPRQVIATPAAAWVLGCCRALRPASFVDSRPLLDLCAVQGASALGVRGGQKIIERFGRRYLGRPLGCHDLRRTFGDRVRRVSDVRIAQLMLGHARLSSTERYLAGSLAERLQAALRIDSVLWPEGFTVGAGAFGPWLGAGESELARG